MGSAGGHDEGRADRSYAHAPRGASPPSDPAGLPPARYTEPARDPNRYRQPGPDTSLNDPGPGLGGAARHEPAPAVDRLPPRGTARGGRHAAGPGQPAAPRSGSGGRHGSHAAPASRPGTPTTGPGTPTTGPGTPTTGIQPGRDRLPAQGRTGGGGTRAGAGLWTGVGADGDRAGADTGFTGQVDRTAPPRSGRPGTPGRGGGRGSRGPLRGYPPLPGQPDPVYPPGQFSAWNRPSIRAAWLGGAGSGWDNDAEPGYSVLAVSDPSADATSTQTWAAIGDTGESPASRPGRGMRTHHAGRPRAGTGRAADAAVVPPRHRGPLADDPGRAPGTSSAFPGSQSGPAPSSARSGPRSAPDALDRGTVPATPLARARGEQPGEAAPASAGRGTPGASPGSAPGRPGIAAGETARVPWERGFGADRARPGRSGRARSNRVLVALLVAPVAVVIAVVSVYVYLSSKASVNAARPTVIPSAPASSPAPTLGTWKHIDSRADDPQPLTLTELFPARVAAADASGTRTVQRAGSNCARAVIGTALRAAVRKAGCTQVMRASYLSGSRKMMATVGVLNLVDVAAAEKAGKASGSTEFIRQLRGAHGPTKNLTKGTGLEEAEVKGHYLILIWSEFANLHAPSSKHQRKVLEHFSTGLINGTVNVSLSSRMVTGHPAASSG